MLTTVSATLTRPNNTTGYGTFTFISDASTDPLLLPMPKSLPLKIVRMDLLYSWALSATTTTIVYFWRADPRPEFNNADQNFITNSRFAGLADRLIETYNVPTNATNGLGYGTLTLNQPWLIGEPNPVIYASLLTSAAINAAANGQVRLTLHLEY